MSALTSSSNAANQKVRDLNLSNKGLIIQYEFCTGCHSCEVACKKELNLPKGQFGIKLLEYGPVQKEDGRWDYFFIPTPTDLCNLCAERLSQRKLPACVHNCQSKVMMYGNVEDLAKKMVSIRKCVMFSPGDKD